MDRRSRCSQPGLVEVRANRKVFERDGAGTAWTCLGAGSLPAGVEPIRASSTLRLVGGQAGPSREATRPTRRERSVARSENRRIEHLARALGLRPLESDGGPPRAA